MTPEGKVKRKIKRVLARYDRLWGDWPVPGGYGKSTLDYIGNAGGRFFAIEAKAPGEEPTTLQENAMRDIRRAGGATFVIDTEDEATVEFVKLKAFLEHHCGLKEASDDPDQPRAPHRRRARQRGAA